MSSVKHSLCWCLQWAKGFYSWLMLMIYLETFSNNPVRLWIFLYTMWTMVSDEAGLVWNLVPINILISYALQLSLSDSELQTDLPCIPGIARRCIWKEERKVAFVTFALFFLLIQFWICLMLSPTEITAELILSGPIFLEYFTIYCIPKNNINFISIIF